MRNKNPTITFLKYAAYFCVLAWSVAPLLLMVVSSFKMPADIIAYPPKIFFTPSLANYYELFEEWPEFFTGLWNSLIITLAAGILTAIVTTLAGYVYSRVRTRFLAYTSFFLILMKMVPPIVIVIPLFPLANYLGLADTHFILVIFYATFFVSLNTWIMKAFIDQIPIELEEAAIADGANIFQLLRYIIVPLALPGIVAASTFLIVYAWNEYVFAYIFATGRSKTAPMVVSEMIGAINGVQWGVLFASATIQIIPVLIFVVAAQKFVVAGLTTGSVKG